MTLSQAALTVLGGFVLPFLIIPIWGTLVQRFRVYGGILAAVLIIGPVWLLNHGLDQPLIYQSSSVVVDMGFAAATGIVCCGLAKGQKLSQYQRNLSSALLGGILAGLILSFFR